MFGIRKLNKKHYITNTPFGVFFIKIKNFEKLYKLTKFETLFKRNYMKISYLFKILVLIVITTASCKKKSEPTTKDLLTAHIWIGVNTNYTVNSIGFTDAQVVSIDSTALEFTKDNIVIFYSRDVNTSVLTERNRQTYTISSDNKKIEISSMNGWLTTDLQALISTYGITVPTSINIEKITTEELILKGILQQNILFPGVPVPVPLTANYTLTYQK